MTLLHNFFPVHGTRKTSGRGLATRLEPERMDAVAWQQDLRATA